MHYLAIEPSAKTYDGFIQAIIPKKGPEYGIELVRGFSILFASQMFFLFISCVTQC